MLTTASIRTWFTVLIVVLVVIFIVGYLIATAARRYIKRAIRKAIHGDSYGGSSKRFRHHSHVEELHVNDDILGAGNLSVAGVGTFRDGIVTGEIGGFCGESVNVTNPLLVSGGLQLATHSVAELKFYLSQSALHRATNQSGTQVEFVLPPAAEHKGAVLVLSNETANANLLVSARPGEDINLTVTSVLVPLFVILYSNGDSTWFANIV
jgi:hypothetical protein